jgi:hypothetical protein
VADEPERAQKFAGSGPRFGLQRALPVAAEGTASPPKAPPNELSSEHEHDLKHLVAAHSTPQKLSERARAILLGATG